MGSIGNEACRQVGVVELAGRVDPVADPAQDAPAGQVDLALGVALEGREGVDGVEA